VFMKGVRIPLTILQGAIAIGILFVTLYEAYLQNKQPDNEQSIPSPTPTVLAIPSGSPTIRPVAHQTPKATRGDNPTTETIRQEIQKVFINPQAVAWADFIAGCESGFHPGSIGSGAYYGLFQYNPATYKNCGGKDIYDWREQIMITKVCMYDKGRQNEFPVCNRRYLSQ